MSEKITDCFMLTEYFKVFGHYYNTSGNNELFGSKIPDGHDIIENSLIIIEDKRDRKDLNKAKEQLKTYLNLVPKEKFENIYLIIGLGASIKEFKYAIYNSKFEKTNMSLENLKKESNMIPNFNIEEIHNLNQYMYDNGINLPKSQKTLFIASVLICLKIDPDFLQTTTSKLISDRMLEIIDDYYSDKTFTGMFQFLKRSIHNKHLLHIFKTLQNDISIYGNDILNRFYSEFCLWDRNNDAALGVVLTPPDIVEIMVKELHLKKTDKVLDFCTGTGSFLIECGKFASNLYGCENNDERYSLAKCNFILHDFNYKNLTYNSCFNEPYEANSFNKVIINPPFNCKESDENNQNNSIGWKSFTKEQKFILYGLQLLKVGGIGCFIVPRSNFGDNKLNSKFKNILIKNSNILKIINLNSKVFYPNASVECAILVLKKIEPINNENDLEEETEICDYSNDGFKIWKNCRIKDTEPIMLSQTKKINIRNNWNYEKNNTITYDNLLKYIQEYNLKTYCSQIMFRFKTSNTLNYAPEPYKPVIDISTIKHFKATIEELIEEIKRVKNVKICDCDDGIYPLLSSTNENNGIKKYIDTYTYDTGKEEILSINRNGSVGFCFVQIGKLAKTADVMIFKFLCNNINNYLLSVLLTQKLTSMFNYSNKISWNRIKDIVIEI